MFTPKALATLIGAAALTALPLMGLSEVDPTENLVPNTSSRLPLEDLRSFAKVFEQIRQGYIEEVDDSTLLEYAIKGMLQGLDPHSSYLDRESFDDLQANTTGEFAGLGIEVGIENDHITVVTPMDDTPAARAGLKAGDIILRLSGKSMRGVSLDEAVERMRGPKGSSVTLTIARKGYKEPFEVTLQRDTVRVRSVRSRILEEGYGYVRISQFQLGTGDDVVKAVNKLQDKSALKGLIIDLRNNPGGVLQSSVEVVDAFLEEGLVVYTEGRTESSQLSYSAEPGDITAGAPIVVLINDGSASAAEIVAGALQDHRRAVVMGTDSFGKGSVQTVIPINSDRAIKLTTALYFTPNGRSIQAQGITPDILVERVKITRLEGPARTTEADLAGHLGNGNGGEERNAEDRKKAKEAREDWLDRDNQIFEALNVLKGLNLYANRDRQLRPRVARAD
ncbi:Carboxy-terminal processing protease CtpB precursor [Microbulbifer aggregans]|uniref:Carboxy-terminal processing protease CtpB n=1 Tax=Microbulbifer aggregans TaxID=1769779 RepID=A0A1C9W4P1_9GAMM|nr:S41 family peptidase [Microbulbifer aggregans]AOS96121.1 Carboxy-terminal processing protease CtpB precursor [Microbulbifer aggregans]